MGLTEALLLIIIIILLAQFMPEALFLGFMGLVIVGGIIVAGIAALLLWQALGPDNLGLIIGGAGLAFFAFVGLRELVRFYQLPLADPPIDPNTGQPLRSPRHVGKVATAVVATIVGWILAGVLAAIIAGLARNWLTYDQRHYAEIASGALLLIAPLLLYFWFRDLYTRREKHYWWRQSTEAIRKETETIRKETGTINMENHIPGAGLDEYLASMNKRIDD